jgi:hypothetical protein
MRSACDEPSGAPLRLVRAVPGLRDLRRVVQALAGAARVQALAGAPIVA